MRSSFPSSKRPENKLWPVLALAVVTLTLAQPRPAHAGCCGETGAINAMSGYIGVLLGSVISGITAVMEAVNLGSDKTADAVARSGVGTIGAMQLNAKATAEAAASTNNAVTLSAIESLAAAQAGANTPSENTQLCKIIHARLGGAMHYYQQLERDSLVRGFLNEGRGRDVKYGTGPAYALYNRATRCIPAKPTGNPLDGMPANCRGANPSESSSGFIDANLLPPSPTRPMRKPPTEKITVTLPVGGTKTFLKTKLDKDSPDEEWTYEFAIDYCYKIAGPSPGNPFGKKLETPNGLTASAQWDHCKAAQLAFFDQCADRIAKFTAPPDCSAGDPDYKEICELSVTACHEAEEAGLQLPPEFDCDKGLSPYQAEYIQHWACMTPQHYVGMSESSATEPLLMLLSNMCVNGLAQWRQQLAAEEDKFTGAVKSLIEMKECWAGVDIEQNLPLTPTAAPLLGGGP